MFQSQNLSQKILLALSGVGFLAVAGWYLMESSISPNESNQVNQAPTNSKELDSLPPGLSEMPLQTQPSGTVKLPSDPSVLPKGKSQSKTKIPGTLSSPNLNLNFPSATSSIPTTPINTPTNNFSSIGTSPIQTQPQGSLYPPSSSQSFIPPTPRKTAKPQNSDGPGSLLPQLPDPLDRTQPSPSVSAKSTAPKPAAPKSTAPKSAAAKSAPVAPDAAMSSPPVSSYAPASDSLQLSPSEFSDPVPLTPSSQSQPPELPPADAGESTPQAPQTQPQ